MMMSIVRKEKMVVMRSPTNRGPLTRGRSTNKNLWNAPAPSTFAASWRMDGILKKAARRMMPMKGTRVPLSAKITPSLGDGAETEGDDEAAEGSECRRSDTEDGNLLHPDPEEAIVQDLLVVPQSVEDDRVDIVVAEEARIEEQKGRKNDPQKNDQQPWEI